MENLSIVCSNDCPRPHEEQVLLRKFNSGSIHDAACRAIAIARKNHGSGEGLCGTEFLGERYCVSTVRRDEAEIREYICQSKSNMTTARSTEDVRLKDFRPGRFAQFTKQAAALAGGT